jgi:ankyrin repeat protein
MSQELLGYVFTDGFNHLAYLGSVNHVVLKDMATLQSDIQRHPAAWEVIRRMSQRYSRSVPWPGSEHDFMLYTLTTFASDLLLQVFLGPSRRVLKPKYQTNPLVYAAHFGKPQHARLLLSCGAKINEKGLVIDASRLALPLEVAVSQQHDAMVDILLSTGSIVPEQLFALSTNHNFPIRITRRLLQTDEFVEWVAQPGNRLPAPVRLLERQLPLVYERDIIIIIRRLVQVGLDPATCNSARKTALYFAIAGGYQAVVVYLLSIGTPLPLDFMSAISRATSSERIPTLRLIVNAGADVRVGEDTALHLAMKTLEQDECLEAVKILVGAGCQPFVYNPARKTPLHLALEQRYFSVADYLLLQQRPAPLDALSAVVDSGYPTIVHTFINGGANIHGVTAYGDGLLHRAVMSLDEQQGLEMAKLLIGTGCDPFKYNVQGKTPLDLALDRTYSLLADYLLSTVKFPPPDALFAILHSALPADWRVHAIRSLVGQGANACVLSTDGSTLLHATVLSLDDPQSLEVAKLLVGIGCEPFQQNAQGITPLDLALDRKFPLVTDYLLSTRGDRSLDRTAMSLDEHQGLEMANLLVPSHSQMGYSTWMQSSQSAARPPASEPPESTSDESFQNPDVDDMTQMSPMMNQFQIHSSRNVDLSPHYMYRAEALQPSFMTFQLSDTMLQPVDDPENQHTLRRLLDMSIIGDEESKVTHPPPSSTSSSSSSVPFGGTQLQGPSMRLQHDDGSLIRTGRVRVVSSNSIPFQSPHSPTNARVDDRMPSGSKQQKKSKMHQCKQCKKMFPRPSGLATHMNSHSVCPLYVIVE